MDQEKLEILVGVTADLVSAYVSNNPVPSDQLPSLIGSIHQSLANLASGEKPALAEPQKPAVPIKKSVTPDFIISLEDGKRFKSLKRHLATHYGMTPSEYRAKWNLPSDYPDGRAKLCRYALRLGKAARSGQKACCGARGRTAAYSRQKERGCG